MEFNLLEEPWIRVRTPECTLKEVSLTDALLHAHEYAGLAGELPTQDVAVLRLLLAVLQTVFYRVDPEGNPSPLEDEEEAIDRWGQLSDHRIGLTLYRLEAILNGDLTELIDALIAADQAEKLRLGDV